MEEDIQIPTKIHQMNEELIKELSSGQVIVDSESVIKELFENALDSGATIINIKLNNFGLDEIVVEDNGSGISEENLELIGKRHCTSKLNTIEDINKVGTYGFRGEALYSISAMADVEIITCDGNKNGNSIQLTTRLKRKVTRKQGTTIIVKRLFNNNKIRREEFIRNKNKEVNKITSLLQHYALMLENIKIVLTHQVKKSISILMQSNGKSLSENLYNVFKTDVNNVTFPIDFENETIKMKGIVSNFSDKGRVTSDRIFLFVNKRPIEHKKIVQVITQQWRSLGAHYKKKFPTAILNIIVDEYDPNVTPDKKKVFFIDEEKVIDSIEKCIENVWSLEAFELDMKNSTSCSLIETQSKESGDKTDKSPEISPIAKLLNFKSLPQSTQQLIQQRTTQQQQQTVDVLDDVDFDSSLNISHERKMKSKEKDKISIHNLNNGIDDSFEEESQFQLQRKETVLKTPLQPKEVKNVYDELDDLLNDDNTDCENSLLKIRNFSSKSQESDESKVYENDERKHTLENNGIESVLERKLHSNTTESFEDIERKTKVLLEKKTQERMNKVNTTITTSCKQEEGRPEIHTSDIDLISVSNRMIVEPTEMKTLIELLILNHQDYPLCKPQQTDQDIIELPKKMKKQTIKEIEIIGQFNKGFIIGKINFDLYIIDQHAADEIYNYETLLNKDQLKLQQLISPLRVDLSADDELFVQENIQLFKPFGFEVIFRETNQPTQRVYLTKVYHRGKHFFGANEFSELVQQLKQCNNDQNVIIKKKHKIFATEACRMSIMIGDCLNKKEMKNILSHLTDLNKPWHCPHGRQTIRHLWDLRKSFNSIANNMND